MSLDAQALLGLPAQFCWSKNQETTFVINDKLCFWESLVKIAGTPTTRYLGYLPSKASFGYLANNRREDREKEEKCNNFKKHQKSIMNSLVFIKSVRNFHICITRFRLYCVWQAIYNIFTKSVTGTKVMCFIVLAI